MLKLVILFDVVKEIAKTWKRSDHWSPFIVIQVSGKEIKEVRNQRGKEGESESIGCKYTILFVEGRGWNE